MTVPESQRMSWGGIVGWSLLCGLFITTFAGLAVLTSRWWWNEFAFKDMSAMGMMICGTGLFVAGTIFPMLFLIKLNWVEEEGPAKIADEIGQKLKD